jgi:hypothetical protein
LSASWLNPTGGLRYHLRAARYRRGLWAPFAQEVARFLAGWDPPERELLLLGPSGGYCLDLGFLRRFDVVTAVEIDPLARWILARRARAALGDARTELRWDRRDHLGPDTDGRFSIAPLRALLAEHPRSAALFCNVLGQLPLLGPDPDPDAPLEPVEGSFERWLLDLPKALEGHSWASFHDRLSGTLRPEGLSPDEPVPWRSSEQLVEECYTDPPPGVEPVLNDHRTSWLARELPRLELRWQLEPGVFHLVEAVSVRRSASGSADEAPSATP